MKDEIKETMTWQLYDRGVMFNRKRAIYSDTDCNFRMYNGDQWYMLPHGAIEPIQYNIIKPIVKHKVGTINANLWAINYSAENFEDGEFQKVGEKVCTNLNRHARRIWEKDNMDHKVRRISKQSCINSEGVLYVNYDLTTGDPINEVINKVDIYYGNENSSDIQTQPYIIIKSRKPVSEIRELAKQNGVAEDKLLLINGDMNTTEEAGDLAKEEVNNMCILLTKMWKENGKVWYSKSTKTVDIVDNTNSGLSLYPVAHFPWEEVEGSSRGEGEVKYITPNQLEINKTAMRRALAVKMGAYPTKVVNKDKITNPEAINDIGATIKVKGMEVDDVRKIVNFTVPSQMSTDAEKLQVEMITNSRELNGAGEITTGSTNPEQASGKAILAIQQANQQPLTEQVVGLKTFIEDIARIWLDMWKVYSKEGKTILEEVTSTDPTTNQPITQEIPYKIPATVLESLKASVKVDVTPKGAFDRYAVELSLENLFMNGKITFDEYVESLPEDSVMPKITLEKIVEARKKAQQEIAQTQIKANTMKSQFDQVANIADELTNVQEVQTTPQMA